MKTTKPTLRLPKAGLAPGSHSATESIVAYLVPGWLSERGQAGAYQPKIAPIRLRRLLQSRAQRLAAN